VAIVVRALSKRSIGVLALEPLPDRGRARVVVLNGTDLLTRS
jgi:hypothetical protein